MKFASWIAIGAGAVALVALACEASDEGTPGSTTCGARERFYNGACALTCVTQADCGDRGICSKVEDNASLCITSADGGTPDGIACSYLESDTKCVEILGYDYDFATGDFTTPIFGGAYTRGEDPNAGLNDNKDSSFVILPQARGPYSLPPYNYSRPWIGNGNCRGNGKLVVVPSSSTPACGQPHTVKRCQTTKSPYWFTDDYSDFDFSSSCVLVEGTTTDRPTP